MSGSKPHSRGPKGHDAMTHDAVTHDAVTEATPAAIERAGAALRAGDLVGLPTETVYGLAADATNPDAIARVYEAKGRPRFNPLIVHVADLDGARALGRFDETALELARAFWPGPLTLVVSRAPDCTVADLATAGLDTIALRVPGHAVARAVIAAAERPLAAPSANLSGRISPTTAEHVGESLGLHVALVLDGGACAVGLESTVVAVTPHGAALLRPGVITRSEIEAVAGPLASLETDAEKPASPGLLLRHYAPRTPLRLDAAAADRGDAVLAFGPRPLSGVAVLNLSETGDMREAAANLFAHLRALDQAGAARIAVMPIPREGLGEAINDRLTRAAAS